ncbi:AtpZ/AtpI family protein [Candidatus Saccharibacteria bacterium]|nr:AtpZ/AtpI family protein [Candidatus Saccharibacteria bacterium]
MTQSPRTETKTTNQPHSAAILLLLTILDTTWRAFVPPIGGTLLGVGLDNYFHKAPIFTSVMIIVGFATSAILITLQIKNVKRS